MVGKAYLTLNLSGTLVSGEGEGIAHGEEEGEAEEGEVARERAIRESQC